MKLRSDLPETEADLWKNALSRYVEESFKKIPDPDPQPGDFKNLTSFSLFADTSLVKFSWISDQYF